MSGPIISGAERAIQPNYLLGLFQEEVRKTLREALKPVVEECIDKAMDSFTVEAQNHFDYHRGQAFAQLTVKMKKE